MNATTPVYRLRRGGAPLLVSMPHAGTHLPPHLAARMTGDALCLPDTDWHLEQLYDFLEELGASVLIATHSRYVVDLNRPADDASLYPGQDVTGLCPIDTFCKTPVYRHAAAPDAAEMAARIERYWRPYHAALADELERLRREHGMALLWEAHSIRSTVPRFFEGRLPDFNLGTASGTSCAPGLGERLLEVAGAAAPFTAVLNGRFKGGHITRHYGKPESGIHAVQLELSQATYMEECHPYRFDTERAERVRPVLRRLVDEMLRWPL